MSENANAERGKRSSAPLWIIIGLTVAPMVAAYIAYYVWPPSAHVNYGELIEPRPLPHVELASSDKRVRIADYKGDWLLVVVDDAACDEHCQIKLVYTRQVRLAHGKDKERIERLWIVTGGGAPDDALVKAHPELAIARDPSGALLKTLPGTASDHIYVIDPLGNLMLRFPPDPDPRRMLKDMSRLLRHSRWK